MAIAHGIHLLHQVSNLGTLNDWEARIRTAVNRRGPNGERVVTAICLRVPERVIETSVGSYDFSLFARAKQIATELGVAFYPRVMYGRHMNDAHKGRFYVSAEADGDKVPIPFTTAGDPEPRLMAGHRGYARASFAWCVANDVPYNHLAWPGLLWAELNNAPEIRNAQGYSYEAFRDSHLAFVEIADEEHAGLEFEFPLSGRGPLLSSSGSITGFVADAAQWAAARPHMVIQANGLGPDGEFGAPDGNTEERKSIAAWETDANRALQMIREFNDYDWSVVIGERAVSANYEPTGQKVQYIEVYTPSFAGGTSAQLYSEGARWLDATWPDEEPPPDPTCEEQIASLQAEITSLQTQMAQLLSDVLFLQGAVATRQTTLDQIHELTAP